MAAVLGHFASDREGLELRELGKAADVNGGMVLTKRETHGREAGEEPGDAE